jgi:hypothetical protein
MLGRGFAAFEALKYERGMILLKIQRRPASCDHKGSNFDTERTNTFLIELFKVYRWKTLLEN